MGQSMTFDFFGKVERLALQSYLQKFNFSEKLNFWAGQGRVQPNQTVSAVVSRSIRSMASAPSSKVSPRNVPIIFSFNSGLVLNARPP